jgi:FkbM family methyltransferase
VIVSLPEFDVLLELSLKNRFLDPSLFVFGIYEISGTRFVQRLLKSGMRFVDVGANSGYYSLIAARLVGVEGHVHAFEPADGPFRKLRRNVQLNGFQNITIYRTAVASTAGHSILHPSADENNDGLGSLIPASNRSTQGEKVPVTTLDHLADVLSAPVDLIKIDVEGGEDKVLAGAWTLLSSRDAPALLFESFDVSSVIGSLEELGYEVRHVHYSLRNGLEFPRVGESFDNLFVRYEAPNYVALKPRGRLGSFLEISGRNSGALSNALTVLAALA